MSRRFNFNTEASIWRQVYTGNKSVLTDTGNTADGFFQPVDADFNTVALGIVGQAYQFVTDGDADLTGNDAIVIDSVEYRVRGVRRNQMKRHDFLTAILSLPVKN